MSTMVADLVRIYCTLKDSFSEMTQDIIWKRKLFLLKTFFDKNMFFEDVRTTKMRKNSV